MLAKVDIYTAEQFMAADPFQIYKQLKLKVAGTGLNSLYALIGAQQGKHWLDISANQKNEILLKLDEMGLAPK
ncbi:TfoX/Sxy family protein [Paraglaciecola aquimarina]|uniref:TfoX/Sxy family protein n=2 Tax=Paraglaciecola algarum TaxID=3050085 RepID=A0ABS9D8E3_9ALTE|nr:TfoX/Sxy family protein [Paraglaciecola sp. G1-23]